MTGLVGRQHSGEKFRVSGREMRDRPGSGEPGRFWLWAVGPGDCYAGAVAVPLMKVWALFQSS
jgi:hypothetical protein